MLFFIFKASVGIRMGGGPDGVSLCEPDFVEGGRLPAERAPCWLGPNGGLAADLARPRRPLLPGGRQGGLPAAWFPGDLSGRLGGQPLAFTMAAGGARPGEGVAAAPFPGALGWGSRSSWTCSWPSPPRSWGSLAL